jgi:predicted oxidoreductase
MKNTQKYVIIFAKDEKGEDIHYRFMLSIGKSIKSVEKSLLEALMGTDGVDRMEIHGRYTAEVVIARSFDAEEVLAELRPKLDAALSDIVVPKLVMP